MILLGFLLAALASAPDPRPGACLVSDGDRITAQDLTPAWAALRSLPGDTALGYAPAPGARRLFYLPELERLGARYQVPPPASPICVERAMESLTPERLLTAMQAALEVPEARIEIFEYSRYAVPRGELEFRRANLTPPTVGQTNTSILWKGWVLYAGNRRYVVWARVRISTLAQRVVAIEPLLAGQPVRTGQLRLETYRGFPWGRTEADTLEQVVGQLPRHTIAAGIAVAKSLLEEPHEVNRGDEVSIDVETGAARLALTGRAESAGRLGDTVSVRNLSSGKTFPARVAEKGRVTVSVKKSTSKTP